MTAPPPVLIRALGAFLHGWGWPLATMLLALLSGAIGALVSFLLFLTQGEEPAHAARLALFSGLVWGALAALPFGVLLHLVDQLLAMRASLVEEIHHRERIERELRQLAETDALTGLLNRRAFLARARVLEGLARRYGHSLAVLMADLDHFKAVNDRFGHAEGDRVLRLFGGLLREVLRGTDLAARFGGDEFVVLMPHTDRQGAVRVAERLRGRLREERESVRCTVSIGIAAASGLDADVERLLTRADRALYRAKHEGRDRIRIHEGEAGGES